MRVFWVRVHRYAGLFLAGFLTLAGLTGSVLSFQHELDAWLNPDLFQAPWQGELLSPDALTARVETANPELRVVSVPLALEAGQAARLSVSARVDVGGGEAKELGYDELFVNPSTAEPLGQRLWGECCLAREQLIPWLYSLHYSLTAPGQWGVWLMGVVALVWMFDCFVGAYLTFPRGRPFLSKWSVSWGIRARRLTYDLHRAGGLWLWGVLLGVAMSGLYFNFYDPFVAVVDRVAELSPDPRREQPAVAAAQRDQRAVSWAEAIAIASEEAARRDWNVSAQSLYWRQRQNMIQISFKDREPPRFDTGRRYTVYVHGQSGEVLGARDPLHRTPGDSFLDLQFPLHTGQILGLPGRILICFAGLALAGLSVTGVVIWMRKRRVPSSRTARRQQGLAPMDVHASLGQERA